MRGTSGEPFQDRSLAQGSPWGGSQLRLLAIVQYVAWTLATRLVSDSVVIREVPFSKWWRWHRDIRQSRGILPKRRTEYRNQKVMDTTPGDSHNQLNWVHRGSQNLYQQSGSPHDLDTLHICYNCVAWSSCRTPKRRSRGCLQLFYWFLRSCFLY